MNILPDSKSTKAVLDLIEWAEKEQITGKATDVSTNHNKYAWEELRTTGECSCRCHVTL